MKILGIHKPLWDALQEAPKRGTVHSIFDKVVNVALLDGQMVSLLSSSMDDGPYALILEEKNFSSLGIHVQDPVVLTKELVTMGPKAWILKDLRLYELSLPRYRYTPQVKRHVETLVKNLEKIQEHVTTPYEETLQKMLQEGLWALKEALVKEDKGLFMEGAKKLLGLGQGLTPTGDDVLLGALLVLSLKEQPLRKVRDYYEELLPLAKEATNQLSYVGLQRGVEGYFRKDLLDFMEALWTQKSMTKPLEKVLSIGHSSGRDMLQGMVLVLKIFMEKEKENGNKNTH